MSIFVLNKLREYPIGLVQGYGEVVLIGSGGILSVGNDHGIGGYDSNVSAYIKGTVIAANNGVMLGTTAANTINDIIVVYKGGSVSSINAGTSALVMTSTSSSITNNGELTGDNGIYFNTRDQTSHYSLLTNTGTISAEVNGIYTVGQQTLIIKNSGTIAGGEAAVYGTDMVGSLKFTNTGEIFGDVLLGQGDDVFNGRRGFVDGAIRGGDGNDKIIGGADNDRLYGDSGNDTLTGGAGDDTFVFAGSGADTITDFSHTHDTLALQLFSGSFRRVGMPLPNEFKLFDGKTNAGVDSDDRILYDRAHGDLYFDNDGSGSKYSRTLLMHVTDDTFVNYTDIKFELHI